MVREPKFEIFRDIQGYYRWRLKAGNGEIVAASEAYTRHQSAIDSVELIRMIAPIAKLNDLTKSQVRY